MALPVIRNTSQQITGASSLAVAWPAGTVAGDTVVIFCSGANSMSSPSGWFVLQNTGTAANWNNGGAFYKAMSPADITAGSVTISATGGVMVAAVVCFIGGVIFQQTVTNWANAATANVTTTTSSAPDTDDLALIFGSARTSATPACNVGSLVQGQNNGSNGASALYTLTPASAGAIAAQFSYSGYNPQGYWQAVVVVSKPRITPLQVAANGQFSNVPFGAPTTRTLDVAFPSGNTAGSTIIVGAGVFCDGGAGFAANTQGAIISDDQGNTYAPLFIFRNTVFQDGPALGGWIAKNVAAGPNTIHITFAFQSFNVPGTSTNFGQCGVAAEYDVIPPTVSIQDEDMVIHTNGPSPGTGVMNLTDSLSNAVAVTISNTDALGWGFVTIDLLFSGNNYLVCFGMTTPNNPSKLPPTVTPTSYGFFVEEIETYSNGGVAIGNGQMYYWDGAELEAPPPTISIACPLGPTTATVGVPYASSAPIVSGDTPPDTFVLLSGPAWMTIDASTGVVSGTPTASGPVTYSIQVTDSLGNIAMVDSPCDLTVIGGGPSVCIVPPATPQQNLSLRDEPLENQGT